MKKLSTKIKLKSSKYRKKFYVLKVECKFDFCHVVISRKSGTLLKCYFEHYGNEIFFDKKLFEKHIKEYKRYKDTRYVAEMKKAYKNIKNYIKKDISNFIIIEDNTIAYGDSTYLYIPFKTKSEYIKFKLKYTK